MFIASKHSTENNTSGQNQPPSCEVTNSLSNKPLEFPTLDPSSRYSPHIPFQSTPDPTYTYSPKIPNPNPDSSLNEEPHIVTPDEIMFLIPNNEVNQLRQHTHVYLQSIDQIPIIYQIPRACTSHIRTQPYSENDTLASTIDDLIIDTISEIIELIETISHPENQEDPKFQKFLNFPKVDSTFHDFLEAEAGGFGPPRPLDNNPTCTNTPSPRPNFSFLSTMAANRPWLVMKVVVVPGI